MSSPSSSGSGKRKREPPLAAAMKKSSTTDLLQPSSRDASGEDADDSAAQTTPVNSRSRKSLAPPTSVESAAAGGSANPPAKRPRTRSTAAVDGAPSNGVVVPSIHKEDPGEPSDTTEASMDIASRSKAKKVAGRGAEEGMKPPPTRLRDPRGHTTNPPPKGRPVRVYADGVFDLFHLGHMRQLEQAKNAFPNTYLLVGVTGDSETHKRKGLTVLTGAERAETVRHCKWVDEVLPGCPWIVTPEFIERHKIDYIAHDDEPYGADEGDDIYKPIKERGQFLVTQRTEGVSTTGIITKIVRDYEKYIARQLKRGTSRQELNVSWLKKNELDLKRHVAELRDSVVTNWSTTGLELGRDFRQFWERSRPASPARPTTNLSPVDAGGEPAAASPKSPTALAHLAHLDIPSRGPSKDFAAGYSLGLIGGVRSWMTRSRVSLHGSQASSPPTSDADESDNEKSPKDEKARTGRGRKEHRSEGDAMET